MKGYKSLLLIFLLCVAPTILQAQTGQSSEPVSIYLLDYLGDRIHACIDRRVKQQDTDHLVEPFRHRNETHRWQTEFWGKWIQGAIASYRYNKDPELYTIIQNAAKALMATQTPDGYIGNYAPDAQLEQWDIWGRKYSMLGLIAWYDLSGDRQALTAACKLLDHLLTQVGPGKRNIVQTGNYVGMASSSVLEPVVYLYTRTKEQRYLDFANYIVEQWETEGGPRLLSKGFNGVPVAERTPHPKEWFSPENGRKAYEMMSCYEGLLELYKVVKNPMYLRVVEKTVQNIIADEINIAGSGSAFECWYHGRQRQTMPTYHTMETCVTFTWMQLCNRLLQLTGNALYAGQIEGSIYNALLAALKNDASQIAKYSPLEGWRSEGEEQCGMHINCCNANGPRAFAMIPTLVYHTYSDTIRVNLYTPSVATVKLAGKQDISLVQTTNYPVTGDITLTVTPAHETIMALSLHIPAWAGQASVYVNGEKTEGLPAGAYHTIRRRWRKGDMVTLQLDMRARLVEMNDAQAIVRGPIVLARDSRFQDGDVDEASVIASKDGYVDLIPAATPDFAWMAFTAPLTLGTDLERHHAPRPVLFCDFASAGNTWDLNQRYRVWLPKTLHVMHQKK